jgi:hypothetical protein
VAAGEDFVRQHPVVFISYSVALILVYLIVIAPLFRLITGSGKSGFQSNLLYTGPGGSLDGALGSCRSDRNQCGTAEPFASAPHPARLAVKARLDAIRSQFASDAGTQRHLSERSRFLGERAPDAVFALGQEDADAMQAEINAITGEDNEATVTVGLHQAAAGVPISNPGAPGAGAAQPVSRFATHSGVANRAEDALGAIAQGYA